MTGSNEQASAEVLAAEDARYAAMLAQDFDALGRLLADDLTYTHSTGATDTKAAYLAALRSGKYRYKSVRREGVTVRVHGTTAIVTGRLFIDLEVDGGSRSVASAFLAVWARNAAGWQLAALQSTSLPKA